MHRFASLVAVATLAVGQLGCSAASPAAPPAATPAAEEPTGTSPPQPSSSEPPASSEPLPEPSATLLRFLSLGRGDQLADLGAGAGYSLLPLVSAVGPHGRVYARHAPKVSQHLPSDAAYETPAESLPANVVVMATPLEAPLAPEVKALDAVTFLFGYQALVTQRLDRARFNAAVLRALKPGGVFVVAERSGGGSGGAEVDTALIRAEVESAGFRFVEAADSQATGLEAGPAGATPVLASVLKFQKAP